MYAHFTHRAHCKASPRMRPRAYTGELAMRRKRTPLRSAAHQHQKSDRRFSSLAFTGTVHTKNLSGNRSSDLPTPSMPLHVHCSGCRRYSPWILSPGQGTLCREGECWLILAPSCPFLNLSADWAELPSQRLAPITLSSASGSQRPMTN